MDSFRNGPRRVVLALAVTLFSAPLSAAIIGGSALLGAADEARLESWLGAGPIDLINAYEKTASDNSTVFHAAVDGIGPTFSIIEVLGIAGGAAFSTPILIGGYNPQSWDSSGSYNTTSAPADRTAFIFDLSNGVVQRQRVTQGTGQYQTLNALTSGPTFGLGNDIWVDGSLSVGSTYGYSYGTDSSPTGYWYGLIPSSGARFSIGRIQVFSIRSAVSVPEPTTLSLLSLGLLGLGWKRRPSNRW